MTNFRDVDIAYIEFCNELTYSDTINELETFIEDGDSKKSNFIHRVFKRLKELFDKLLQTIEEFRMNLARKRMKKIQEAIQKNPKLKNKKIYVKSLDKYMKLAESCQKKVMNAKSVKEVDKVKKEWSTKKKVIDGTSVGIGITSIGVFLNKIHKSVKEQSDLNNELEEHLETRYAREEEIQRQAEELERQTAEKSAKWKERKEAERAKKEDELKEQVFRMKVEAVTAIGGDAASITKESIKDIDKELNEIYQMTNREFTKRVQAESGKWKEEADRQQEEFEKKIMQKE